MTRPIGYYVHHQGFGHFDRARTIARTLHRRCTLIGTLPPNGPADVPVLRLPDDSDGGSAMPSGDGCMPHALHFAPLDFGPVRERMGLIADWVRRQKPALMIVDVSVEVALFCRLLSVPVLAIRLAGDRSDPAHLEAFRAARRLIAPFPQSFEHAATPVWVREKTFYAGFIHAAVKSDPPASLPGTIGIVLGSGGAPRDIAPFVAAACSVPERAWHVFGTVSGTPRDLPANLIVHGFVDSIEAALARMEILVGAAGDGVVSLAVSSGKRFLCIPEKRPYQEQVAKAAALEAMGAAIVCHSWPKPSEWPAILDATMGLDVEKIRALRNDDSLRHVATVIDDEANRVGV